MPPTDDRPFDARAHLDRVRDQLRQAGPPPSPAELGEILQLRAWLAELERGEHRDRWRDVCCTKPANHADAHRRITTGGDIDRWVYEGELETARALVAKLEAERDDYRFRLKAANSAYIAMSTKLDAQVDVQRVRGDAAEAAVTQVRTAAEPIERDVQALEDALHALPADAPLVLHAKGARLMSTALDVRRALDAAGTPATRAPDGAHRARRNDEVATWIKRYRDTHTPDSTAWRALDGLLDDYRLHADVGEPLDRDVHEPPCDRLTGCEVCCPMPATPDGEATDA